MLPLFLLLACHRGEDFDLSGVWRLEIAVEATADGTDGQVCEERLLHNVSDAIEESDGDTGDTGTGGWTEESDVELSPETRLVRFVRDGARWLLISGGEMLPQEEGGDAAAPTFAWERSELSRQERTHMSGYAWVEEIAQTAVQRVQVELPNEQAQTDAERTEVPVSLQGSWSEQGGTTSSWEESDLWPEELGLGEAGAIPFASYLTRLDSLGYVVPVVNQRAVADCSDERCVLTVGQSCAWTRSFTATRTEIDAGDPGWQDLQWEAGY
ncbi:hypothetical protein L6R53_10265 [Myxococcota bacterium]|nr:hypothetical protein [Myxococcota bacterium]